MKAQTTNKMMKAQQRTEFMQAGGYDGRFRSKSVPNKKAYTRKGRNGKSNFEG